MEQAVAMTEVMASLVRDIKDKKVKCVEGKFQCSHCYNSGFRQVADPNGSKYIGVVRCDKCKYWAFRADF